jgi:Arc/MetJ-type ribon-helix-helix transcriptional regulator
LQAIDNNGLELTVNYLSAVEERVSVWKSEAQVYDEVECRKKIYFFPPLAGQENRVEESQLNPSLHLLSKFLIHCRFGDNILFGLISHFCSQANLSTSENKVPKNKTRVIATRVTERFANLLEQHCRKDAYINFADFIRDALREKLRKDAPERFKLLLEGAHIEQEEEKIAAK